MVEYDGAMVPQTQCDYIIGPEVTSCYMSGSGTYWSGCVGSRAEPLNLRDSSPSSRFPGLMNTGCGSELLPLVTDEAKVLNKISSLWPTGKTYIPEGVMWGMRTLSTDVPYTEGSTPSGIKKVRKILVLMTDGDNQAVSDLPSAATHRPIYSTEADYAANKEKTDGWTLEACSQAAAAGIEVFTISFGTDISAASRKLIKDCAADKDHYFDAMDAEELNEAFKAIAADVSGFYLSG